MEYNANTKWVIWYHSITDKNWDNDSYKKIFEINNLKDLFYFKNNLNYNHLFNSMLFVMRDGIFPTWEDNNNKNGGMLSYKINSKNIFNEFINLIESCVCENVHSNTNNYNLINGLSVSPKKEFNILKIWIRNNKKEELIDYNSKFIHSKNMIYKKN